MPLDDREQRILAEIERQFYAEDPDLAHAVRNIDRSARFGLKLPISGLIAGALVLILTYTKLTVLALAGFALAVVSATALVHGIRARRLRVDEGESNSSWWAWMKKGRPFRRT